MDEVLQTVGVAVALGGVLALPVFLVWNRSARRRKRAVPPAAIASPASPRQAGPDEAALRRIAELEAALAAERAHSASLAENHALAMRLCALHERIIREVRPELLKGRDMSEIA